MQFLITTIAALIIGFGVGYDVAMGEKLAECEAAPGKDQLISSIRRADGGITCTYASGYGRSTYTTAPRK